MTAGGAAAFEVWRDDAAVKESFGDSFGIDKYVSTDWVELYLYSWVFSNGWREC